MYLTQPKQCLKLLFRQFSTCILLMSITVGVNTNSTSNALAHISEGTSTFSNDLYEILSREEGNVFYSPISVHVILSLLYQGADGDTAQDLKRVLHLTDKKIAAEGYQNLMEKLNSAPNVKLNIANKIFVSQAYALQEEFKSLAKNRFLSEAEGINFPESEAAAKTINDWVEIKTNNKIKELFKPEDLGATTRLVLVNAIYFKGDWLHMFETYATRKEHFYLSETQTVKCDMMHMANVLRYREDNELDAQILSLPYKNENLSFLIILPRSKTGIKNLEKKLQTKSLTRLNQNFYSEHIVLSLPKFRIETKMTLNAPLSELGLDVMFSDAANFPYMLNSSEGLKVSKVVQKAFIEVNEEGAEAAAATGGTIDIRSGDIDIISFEANHPFIFGLFFYTNGESFPLFMGKFTKP